MDPRRLPLYYTPLFVFVIALTIATNSRGEPPPASSPGDKVTVRAHAQPGQSWAFEQSYELQLTSTMSADGKQPQEIAQNMHQERSGTVTVLEATDGVINAMKITFDATCGAKASQTGQERQDVEFPLAGKTVTLHRTPDGTIEHDFLGSLDTQTINELTAMLEPESRIYPPEPVPVGASWKMGKSALARHFQLKEGDDAVGACRLDAVKTIDGRSAADLAIGVSLVKYDQGFMKTEINLKGAARVDLATGHTTAGVLEGPLVVSGSQRVVRDGKAVTIHVNGGGKVSFRSASRWLTTASPNTVASTAPSTTPEPPRPAIVEASGPVARPASRPAAVDIMRPLPNVLAAGGVAARPLPARPVAPRSGRPAGEQWASADGDAVPPVMAPATTPEELFSGVYRDDSLRLEMKTSDNHTTGTIRLGAQRFPFNGVLEKEKLEGTFEADGTPFGFSAVLDGPVLVFTTESTVYRLKREPANPLAK